MRPNFNRRLFLRGLGGAVVAAPFLPSVHERAARAAGAAVGSPKRLVIYFTHYGCITDRFFPDRAHGALSASDFEGKTIASLGEFADKILIPRGIRAMNQWDSSGRLGQQNDPHTQVTGSLLSCQPVTPDGECSGAQANNCIIPSSTAAKNNAKPIGPTIDHIAAEQINQGADKAPLVLKIGGNRDNDMSAISYSASETEFEGYGEPSQVFSSLTNLFNGGGNMTPDDYRAARGKSIVDIVAEDLASLKRLSMSKADQDKIDAWTELLHASSNSVVGQYCTEEVADMFGLPGGGGGGGGGIGGADVTSPMVTDLMMNLAVLTMLCDANRVVLMKYPPNYTYSGLGHDTEFHGLSHRIGTAFMGGSCDNGVIAQLMEVDTFHAEKFAYLLRTMNEFSEGDGTLLDNSATVWIQELSDGNAHNLNNLPIIQAGSCGGYFKVGEAINLENGSESFNNGNSYGDCEDGNTPAINAGSHPAGTPNDIANQPINKYFCNLLNAIGVKANAEGFAEMGGTAEVTKFGKFDDTSRFKGGLSGPAEFVNEGEFAELKA